MILFPKKTEEAKNNRILTDYSIIKDKYPALIINKFLKLIRFKGNNDFSNINIIITNYNSSNSFIRLSNRNIIFRFLKLHCLDYPEKMTKENVNFLAHYYY